MDRRRYSRIPVEIDGNIVLSGIEKRIKIDNISESGIGFYLDETDTSDERDLVFKIGERVEIQFVDTYNFEKDEYVSIQTVVGIVAQVRQDSSSIYIGCSIDIRDCADGTDYPYYVEHRKSCRFVTIARNMRYR